MKPEKQVADPPVVVRRDHPEAQDRHWAQEERGWVRVSCVVADIIRVCDKVTVNSSLTDLDGTYGEPKLHTVWGLPGSGDVLDEYRWPAGDEWPAAPSGPGDRYRCEHYAPGRSA